MRLILIIVFCVSAMAATPPLEQQVNAKIANFPGKVSLYAKNLQTGESYGRSPDEPVRTASTIKLAIMVECFAEAAEGKVSLTEPIRLVDAEKVTGSGLLQEFSDGDQLPLRDVIDLMIVVSDNTATNLILNRIGGNAVNARMAQLGLTQTRVMRKIMGDSKDFKAARGWTEEGNKPENKKWGTGRSSPHEMVILLEKLYRGELVSKSSSDEMLTILKRQRDHDCIGRDMKDVTIANKSGALDHLRSDVGIVYSKRGPIAMAVTVEDIPEVNYTPDNPGDLLINAISEVLAEGLAASH